MKFQYLVATGLLLLLSACASKKMAKEESQFPPPESELPTAPNCSADGPGCKQFNPNLK